jgi:hypothetical protein
MLLKYCQNGFLAPSLSVGKFEEFKNNIEADFNEMRWIRFAL